MRTDYLDEFLSSSELKYGFSISIACTTLNDTSKPEFIRKENVVHPAASLAKLFILGAIANDIAGGKLSLSQQVDISQYVLGSGLLKYIQAPMKLSLEFLVHLMIIYSDNSATNCLLSLVTIERVRQFVYDLGAKSTRIEVPMMPRPAEVVNGHNQTTTADVLLFYKALVDGFPQPINAQTAELCKGLLSPTRSTIMDILKLLNSRDGWKCSAAILQHNSLKIPKYVAVLLSPLWNARLTGSLYLRSILARKSATDKYVYHDSCLVETSRGLTTIVMMIEGTQGHLNDPKSEEYQEATHCARVIANALLCSAPQTKLAIQ